MQLSYRGVLYQVHIFPMKPAETDQDLMFRGNRYKAKHLKHGVRKRMASQLTYRGVRYVR